MVLALSFCMNTEGTSLKCRIEELEKEEIIKALKECNWVMARAAKRLGITERMIGYKIHKYGLRIKEVRWSEGASEVHEDHQEQKESH
jgi:Nif-specific regulatory protein